MAEWFARPMLHVKDVASSVRFYEERLGFTSPWHFDDNGVPFVAQVERDSCALLLVSQWPDKIGKGMMFISLNVEPGDGPGAHAAHVAALDTLRAELEARGATVTDGSWGYRLLVVADPDGNQLYFNYPNDRAGAPPDQR